MKKKLLLLLSLISVVAFTGCGSKTNLDLDEVQEELSSLKTENFDFFMIQDNVEDAEHIYDEDIYETDKEFGLKYEHYEQILARRNSQTGEMYIVIKVNQSAGSPEVVKDCMEKFMQKQSLSYKEDKIEDYSIYVIDNEPDEIIERIKNTKGVVFQSLIEIKKADLENLLNVKESWVEESLVMNSAVMINANQYIIIKPVKDKYEDVKKAIENYMAELEKQWKNYLPDQYDLVKNRKVEKFGDYLIYIISNDNEAVYKKIESLGK